MEDAWAELELLPPALRTIESVIELRVEILLKLERWKVARFVAKSQAKRFPENPTWWLQWASTFSHERLIKDARAVLLEAVQRLPSCALIHYNLACYAALLGDRQEAKARLSRAFALDYNLREMTLEDPDLAAILADL